MKGNVRLRIECPAPEPLLRRALTLGIAFTGVRRTDARTLIVDTDAAGARKLMKLCRRYSISAAIVRRSGSSAVRAFILRRATLPVGLLAGALLCAMFLGRVWRVEIGFTGEAAGLGDAASFARLLDEMGVRPGMPRDFDADLLAKRLQARVEGYSFVGIRRRGIVLIAEAAPELPAPQVYEIDAARDLVARQDGIVISAVARSGALCVAAGDTVRRGQLLIRGEERCTDDAMRPIAALGEVVIRTWYEGAASLPLTSETTRPTGRRRVASRLRAGAWEWPIARCEGFDSQMTAVERLPVVGLYVPLVIERTIFRETETVRAAVGTDALRDRLARLAMSDAAVNLCENAPDDGEIARTWIEYETCGGDMRAHAVYEITTDAAVTRDALLQGG